MTIFCSLAHILLLLTFGLCTQIPPCRSVCGTTRSITRCKSAPCHSAHHRRACFDCNTTDTTLARVCRTFHFPDAYYGQKYAYSRFKPALPCETRKVSHCVPPSAARRSARRSTTSSSRVRTSGTPRSPCRSCGLSGRVSSLPTIHTAACYSMNGEECLLTLAAAVLAGVEWDE